MKFGKIYYYRNKEEARKLIGKKVIASDIFYRLENPTEKHYKLGILEEFAHDEEFPFKVALSVVDWNAYQFIREIEEDEPKLMTNRQLAKWASKRLGEIKNGKTVGVCVHYDEANGNYPPDPTVRIRYWDSDEWVVPTVDIYERDCIGIKSE